MRSGSGQRATETRLNPARGSWARGGAGRAASSRLAAQPARLPEPGSAVTRAQRSAGRSWEAARPARPLSSSPVRVFSGRVSGGLDAPAPRLPASEIQSPALESPRPAPPRRRRPGPELRACRGLPGEAARSGL